MASSKHDFDKENVHRTRIPLPKDPLPALPKHLLIDSKKTYEQENIPQRSALKILNARVIPKAGPSKVMPHKHRHSLMLDTKHVTLRQRSEDLDWHYTVFKDERVDKDGSAVSISDDESYLGDKENHQCCVEKKKKSTLGVPVSAVTPTLKASLEPNRVRNIKRSLKRPHSRELQGLSPPVTFKLDKVDSKVRRRLQFSDRLQDGLGIADFWKRSYMRCLNRDYTTDVFDYLLAVESKPLDLPRTSNITRACVINWLMKVNDSNEFQVRNIVFSIQCLEPYIMRAPTPIWQGSSGNPAIIQSACWYLDSILGTGHVQLDKLQLVAAACYWIAQKLNGPVMPAMRLVKCANRAFTTDKLLAAEKAVLIRLRFPQQPVVAQDYITYLSWWCDTHDGGDIELAATFLCMCGLMVDRVLCDEYPSVIAAAAVRNALLLLRKRELIPRLQMCHVFKAAGKKASDLSYTCAILRRAVRTVAAPIYEYKAPFEHFSMPPYCMAQRIICAANELSVIDARNTDRR